MQQQRRSSSIPKKNRIGNVLNLHMQKEVFAIAVLLLLLL